MENPTETLPKAHEDDGGPDSPSSRRNSCHDLQAELEESRSQSKLSAVEESLNLFQRERDEAVTRYADSVKLVAEISSEKDSLRDRLRELEASTRGKEDEFMTRIDEEVKEREKIEKDVVTYRERIEELGIERKRSNEFLFKCLDSIRSAKESLGRIIKNVDEEKIADGKPSNGVKESDLMSLESELNEELMVITRLAFEAEEKVSVYTEVGKKERRELENSVVSLTKENRDINSLLRVALLEKEAVEKRLKVNSEQKRVALLQRVGFGFGFMMGSGNNEQLSESSSGTKSDSSECEEEVVSLASTVERIMKNLRLEISQLRRSLEESRSDTERLQSLAEKQAQTIAENKLYIKELEERERVLAQNVEELLLEIKETQAGVTRWREACELEVEAGKVEIGERDKVIAILKQELERTKVALDTSNGKLKLKEQLVAAAMAAQAAAEKSLQLADGRSAGLRERIEELTRQLEEAESRERSSRRVRHICWPWRVLTNNVNNRMQNVRRMIPEMQAFLH
ncbi:ATP-binding protein [Parasponia andersonii]|uniref:ATP-binding protein n=1 Tax=Parasponia andersonii TaxID=3476 RepID=A0A2P5BSI4_PARAD|nr:ATP-binding protein [Parasponia andersonii]